MVEKVLPQHTEPNKILSLGRFRSYEEFNEFISSFNFYFLINKDHSFKGVGIYRDSKKDIIYLSINKLTDLEKHKSTSKIKYEYNSLNNLPNTQLVSLVDYFVISENQFDLGAFNLIFSKLLMLFNFNFNVRELVKNKYLSYPKIKASLFNKGLLNNLKITNTKIITTYDTALNIDNLDSNIICIRGNDKNNLKSIFQQNNSLDIILYTKIPGINTTLKFYIELCDVKNNAYNGYNPPKDKTIRVGDEAKVIRTDFKYSNFLHGDILEVVEIFINSKTPQKHSALCIRKSDGYKSLVHILNLKKL